MYFKLQYQQKVKFAMNCKKRGPSCAPAHLLMGYAGA